MPAGFSFGPLQLPLSPMGVFAILIELPNDVTVQRSHDADGRHHLVCKFVQKQNRRAEYDAGGFAMVGPDGGQFPVHSRYRFRATPQRNPLVKLNAGAPG
jgi:hypothetical protein